MSFIPAALIERQANMQLAIYRHLPFGYFQRRHLQNSLKTNAIRSADLDVAKR